MGLKTLAEVAARSFEIAGISAMIIGALVAFGSLLIRLREPGGYARTFQRIRSQLGYSILLGLELLIASDIIFTITERPAFESVAVLGLIVLIRTFLSFTLEVELEGKWPWRRV